MKLKLTLRDLFWLVLVVAMGLGWFLDRRVLKQQVNSLAERLQRLSVLTGIRRGTWAFDNREADRREQDWRRSWQWPYDIPAFSND